MHPAFSVIFLTTLIGVGQGLFLALYTGQVYSLANLLPAQDSQGFYAVGSLLSFLFMGVGLLASFFHLGRPERAWRSVTQWRTSWLSREVIMLPLFMLLVFMYGVVHYFELTETWFIIQGALPVDATLVLGLLASISAFLLFGCTAMIYASVKFLQEWHTPLTPVNYTLLGMASGFMLAAAFSAYSGIDLAMFYGTWAVIFTLMGLITRGLSLYRNRKIKHSFSLQSAIGVRHNKMAQKAQGFMGGSFNTKEFFHGQGDAVMRQMKYSFMLLVFPVPVGLIVASFMQESVSLSAMAFGIQYLGLLAERWYFFADAKHPQNLYYQSIA